MKIRILSSVALSGLLLAAGRARAEDAHLSVWVLAVAESESFERDLAKLRFAQDDVDRFARVMTATGQVPVERIVTMKETTVAGLRAAFAAMATQARATNGSNSKQRFVFYYTGHSDATGLHLVDGLMKKSELTGLIAAVPAATRIAFFDACYSGALAAKGVRPAADFAVPRAEFDEPSGTVFFAATSAQDVAFEIRELGGSLFTHHLVAGLYGAADANRDGIVTVDELYQYVYGEMERLAVALPGARPQKPEFRLDLSGRGALVLAYIARTTSPVIVAPDVVGDISFATDGGLQIFRLEKRERAPVSLKLVPGKYAVTVRDGERVGRASFDVAPNAESRLDGRMLAMEHEPNLDVVAKGARTAARYILAVGASASSYTRWGPEVEVGLATPAERIEASEWRVVALAGARKNELFYRSAAGEQSGFAISETLLIGARGAFFSSGDGIGLAGQEWHFVVGGGADYLQQHWRDGSDDSPRRFDPMIPKVAFGFGTSLTRASGGSLGVTLRREFPFAKDSATGDVLAFGASVVAVTAEW